MDGRIPVLIRTSSMSAVGAAEVRREEGSTPALLGAPRSHIPGRTAEQQENVSPQFLDVGSDPREAVNAVHHAVLLDELCAALQDLRNCGKGEQHMESLSSGLSSAVEPSDCRFNRDSECSDVSDPQNQNHLPCSQT